MRRNTLIRVLGWSLLVAPWACNSLAISEAVDGTSPAKPVDEFSVDLRESVEYLASDELEGRGVGTPGIDKAADYIASTFKGLGLQSAPGLPDYFQGFSITSATAPDPKTTLSVNETSYKLIEDFTVVSFSGEADFKGEVVFVGYGISSEQYKYDDYANIDVKGKIALALRYEPHDAEGKSRFTGSKDDWSPEATLMQKAKTAAEHGAVALFLVNSPNFHDDVPMPFANSFMGERASIPFLFVKRPVAEEMLKRAEAKELTALQSEIDESGKPLAHPLPGVDASGTVAIQRTETQVKNVVGIIPGTGPLAEEFVVVGAHYDHLGRGGRGGSLNPGSEEIHNGADDNASGVAALLELAEHYAKAGTGGRSILFVAFTAEEEGLIGSNHFVNHSQVPLEKIASMLNLDMVGRIRSNSLSIGGTGTAASFEKLLADADEASPLELKNFGKGGFGPSDHMSFALKKIPVLFFFSGTHPDYHRPSDDADKVNYEGMQQVVQLGVKVVDTLATMPREEYVSASDHSGMASGGRSGSRVTLGVVPDYGSDEGKGVLISGTVPGSPAETAGLKGGDLIVQFNADKIGSLYDLTDSLAKGKAGDSVKLVVVREGKNVDLTATLAERKG